MPLIECRFHSQVLGLRTTISVILPYPAKKTGGRGRYPTLYLLHGLTGDHTDWLREIPIERYVEPLNLAVVTCDGHRSRYTDMALGWRYWTFLTEELPFVARSLFPLSSARKDNFVAGASMGGYGAFKWALRKPEMFAAAASLSGAFRIASGMDPRMTDPARRREFRGIFGALGKLRGSEHDLFALSRRAVTQEAPPPGALSVLRDGRPPPRDQPALFRAGAQAGASADLRGEPRRSRMELLGPADSTRPGMASAQPQVVKSKSVISTGRIAAP